jgi:hypothetical protein
MFPGVYGEKGGPLLMNWLCGSFENTSPGGNES